MDYLLLAWMYNTGFITDGLQLTALIGRFILPKLFDTAARQKWTRETTLLTIVGDVPSYDPVFSITWKKRASSNNDN
jgi:hypothetical protein